MSTTRMPPAACPSCSAKLDAATGTTTDDSPQAGDYTVCYRCAAVLQFNQDMTLRVAQFREMPLDLQRVLRRTVQIVKALPMYRG